MRIYKLSLVVFMIYFLSNSGYGQQFINNDGNRKHPLSVTSGLFCPVYSETIHYSTNIICENQTTVLHAPSGFVKWEWSDGKTTETDTVGPGTYSVKVTDASNCEYIPPSVTINHYLTVVPAISASGPTTFCEGGSVTLRVSAGFISSIHWSNDSSGTYIIVKSSGSYTVTTTDGIHGCPSTSAPTVVIVNKPTFSDTTVKTCVSYTWNGIVYTSGGVYTYKTTNSVGCDSIATLHLSLTTLSGVATKTDAKCYGSATGSITVNPTSGTPPFYYRLGTKSAYTTNNTFNNLRAGRYIVFITDSVGCIGLSNQVTISQDPPLTGNATTVNPVCNASKTGSITINPTSGIPPFQYKLGTAVVYSGSNTFTNMRAGNYRATIMDAEGCTGTITNIKLIDPPAITANYTVTNVVCNGAATGKIEVLPTSGSAPFSYKLGTAGTYTSNNIFSGLRASKYIVYLKDNDGCVITKMNQISQPDAMFININKGDESCPGSKDGFIDAAGGNGVAPYTFKFGTTGAYDTIHLFTGLKTGSYRIYVKDANNCQGPSVGVSIALTAPFCLGNAEQNKLDSALVQSEPKGKLEARLYPNPSSESFTLQLKSAGTYPIQIRVIGVDGKVVSSFMGNQNQVFRFGNDLTTGIYLVDIIQGDSRVTLKAIKAK